MLQNIKYDHQGFLKGKYDFEPEDIYKKRCTVCEVYSKTYKKIGECLAFEIEKIYLSRAMHVAEMKIL